MQSSLPKKGRKKYGVIFGIGIVLILFFGFTFGREALKNYEISREIKNLEKQAADLESRNAELSELSKKLGTLDYLEAEARTKFGFKKEGEQAAVILPEGASQVVKNTLAPAETAAPQSNLVKWWNYFFGAKTDQNNIK